MALKIPPAAGKDGQLTIRVSARTVARLRDQATKRGVTTTDFATQFFEAAYAARCGETGDRDLDATVAATLLLTGKLDTDQIARALRTNEVVVARIRKAWERARP